MLEGDAERREWTLNGPHLTGFSIYHAIRDPRDGTLYAATNFFEGGTVHRSSDNGETWERAEELGLPEGGELKLNATWHVEPGGNGELWLGGDPGVLFRSDDQGVTWQVNEGILHHKTRDQWNPGAGGMCLHSINVDPDDAKRMVIGISAAGVFRTDDGGETWEPANKGTSADFLPDVAAGGRPVRPQGAHPSREARPALAAEPLRRLPLRRPRHLVGAARRERAAERLRVRADARPARPGRGVHDPRGERDEPRRAEQPARRLPHARRRLLVGAAEERAAAAGVGRRAARGVGVGRAASRTASTSARRPARSWLPPTAASRGTRPLAGCRRSSRSRPRSGRNQAPVRCSRARRAGSVSSRATRRRSATRCARCPCTTSASTSTASCAGSSTCSSTATTCAAAAASRPRSDADSQVLVVTAIAGG